MRDVEVFPCLEVDAPPPPELSVGSEGAVGPTYSVISINRSDSCLSKGDGVFVPGISVRDEERVDIVLGRSTCCYRNDLS